MPELSRSDDVAQADWIRGRLAPFGSGVVTSVVPAGFAAYARVLHPARSAAGPVRWSAVAAGNGVELRRDAQFPEVALLPPGEGRPTQQVGSPEEGTLSAADAAVLIEILRAHTSTPQDCWCCVWEGYDWQEADPGPRVELPERDYLLHRGPLDAVAGLLGAGRATPNLWWPADRAWCVATEIDLEWTYVGGAADLIERLVADGRIEACLAEPTDHCHRRLPPWLDAAIDAAAVRLRTGGAAEVRTQLGVVSATLRRPRRWRHGELRTESRRHGSRAEGASGWTRIGHRGEDALHEEIRHELASAVVDLLSQ